MTTSAFKQLPMEKYHISHAKAPLALSHSSPQEACMSRGRREGGYKAAAEIKDAPIFGFSLLCFLHSYSYHECTVKWWAKAHPLWTGTNAACSCKSPSKSQPLSTHMHLRSSPCTLQNWEIWGLIQSSLEGLIKCNRLQTNLKKTKCFYSDWEAYWCFPIFFSSLTNATGVGKAVTKAVIKIWKTTPPMGLGWG